MKVLFDEDAPRPLRRHLPGHVISTVQEMGWAGVKNGELLTRAEGQGFEVLLTFDQNLQHQQNLAGRRLGVLVIVVPNKRMQTLVPLVPDILAVLPAIQPGQVYEVTPARTPTLSPGAEPEETREPDRNRDIQP